MIDNDIEYDRTCQNCTYFFSDSEDMDFGICMNEKIFEPYLDEIIESENFSCCHELYLQNRLEGLTEACEQFEEIPDMTEVDYENICLSHEAMRIANVDDIVNHLYKTDTDIIKSALSQISIYVLIGNIGAYEGLLNFYLSLGPAVNLDDVYIRKDIVNMLSRHEQDKRTIEAYVYELERTPSNNTTRQLYSLILEHLNRCNNEIVFDLLDKLLNKKEFCSKLTKRIIDVMWNDNNLRDYPF